MLPPHFNGYHRRINEHAERMTLQRKRADEAQSQAIAAALDEIEQERTDLDARNAAEAASPGA